MEKDKARFLQLISQIQKNSEMSKWRCVYTNCQNESINSHLLQRNGILNNIVEKGHLIEFKQNSGFNISKGIFSFVKTGINKAVSIPLFCKEHDTEIFKVIESGNINFNSYYNQMLFSYRSVCAELRRKEKIIDEEIKFLKSDELASLIDNDLTMTHIYGLKRGVEDLMYYKREFEKELFIKTKKVFTFKTLKYAPIEVCTSSVFSPIPDDILSQEIIDMSKKPLKTVFINAIPQPDALYIIIGHHNKFLSNWINKYISSWNTSDVIQQQLNISNLVASRVGDWALSISLFEKITEENQRKFIRFWENNFQSHSEILHYRHNLFD